MKFTYSSGQRVLDGYTLKRGIGRGGFGEVYYAVSDGGKDVALKLIRGQNLEVELRGMAQCLNLKHPNLLALYDLRADAEGDHWVVMEYISGEPLSTVLNRHPRGLPLELAQQWFLALARAVAYLHDNGIVHRDLKPGNIFLESGTVKVGDYGLSKSISSSQRSEQTQSVGTVHYMAPEISTGNYNKQIDIYASGVIFFEMLTGKVPFEGESAGEILMKHLTSTPDLQKVPDILVPVVAKALAKNPCNRYATMGEMAKAIEEAAGANREWVGQSVVASQVSSAATSRNKSSQNGRSSAGVANSTAAVASLPGHLAELCGSLALSAALAAMFWGFFASLWDRMNIFANFTDISTGFFLTLAVCWVVIVPARCWGLSARVHDAWSQRLVMMLLGLLVGCLAFWLDRGIPEISERPVSPPSPVAIVGSVPRGVPSWVGYHSWAGSAGYLVYFSLALFAIRWWKMADRRRWQRFSFAPVLAAGFWGLSLLTIWPQPWRGTVVLMTASAIIQLVSPWEPPVPPSAKKLRLRNA